jgi:predicted transcriptional regulator of viral defense system
VNAATAYATLSSTGLRALRTSEAAALLRMSPLATAQLVRRLGQAGLVQPLMRGVVWLGKESIDPWAALEWVTAPYPAYASLYSALYLRGALSQIPVVHYAVTLGRAHRIRTGAGTYSLHRVAPELFGGFETLDSGAKLATLEKALFDLAYLSATRSRLFARPPELELPRSFDLAALQSWVERIRPPKRRAQTQRQLELLTAPASRRRSRRRPSRS